MGLRSGVAVAVAEASGYSSNSIPSLGTSICHGYGPKKQNKIKYNVSECSEIFGFKDCTVVQRTCESSSSILY